MTKRPYFALVQRYGSLDKWMIEFGDYDRDCVVSELEDYRDHGCKSKDLKIIRTPDDHQATIDAAVTQLNNSNRS